MRAVDGKQEINLEWPNINVFCSVRKSQQELVSMNCSVSVGVAVSALG